MGLRDLITVLVEEHATMREGLLRAKAASARGDFEAVGRELRSVDPVFRQHICDEESQVLGLLIRQLGKERAADEIRVFQQHRPIYALMQKISEFAALTPEELAARQEELSILFEEHTAAEQNRVFPKALALLGDA